MSLNETELLIKNYVLKENIDKIQLIGLVSTLIISKEVMKKNSEAGKFVEYVIGEEFPSYVIKSRTLIAARVNKILVNLADEDVKKVKRNVTKYIKNLEDKNNSISSDEINSKNNRKRNENDKLQKWLKGL